MINLFQNTEDSSLSFEQLELKRFQNNFTLPIREKSFANIHQHVLSRLQEGKHVVLVQIDGLGYDSTLEAIASGNKLFNAILKHGKFEQWSAQWPATTTVQMTTLYSGLTVEEHGLLEWVTFDPKSEMLISPLTFSSAREERRNTLYELGIKPEDVFTKGNFSKRIEEEGFSMFLLGKNEYVNSPMCEISCPEAIKLGAETLADSTESLLKILNNVEQPAFVVLYTDLLDKANHNYTKHSHEHVSMVDSICQTLSNSLKLGLSDLQDDFLIILTSDHGHMSVNANEPLYVNQLLPDIDSRLQKRKDGTVIPCSGGYRSLFLHALPEQRDLLIAELNEALIGKADVYKLETLVKIGVFNEQLCNKEFFSKAGNVCVLPYAGQTVYYYIPGIFEMKRASVHGGASTEEMQTPYFEFTREQFMSIRDAI